MATKKLTADESLFLALWRYVKPAYRQARLRELKRQGWSNTKIDKVILGLIAKGMVRAVTVRGRRIIRITAQGSRWVRANWEQLYDLLVQYGLS